ncbi:ABC transporter substrate-binding protein [Kitasatospora sp. NPDC058201]|uniref:ABC transporter substrate-binding protein n=1 Tax=unclassified Kitasatospora TaxID=2633591 RepID=UPI00365B451F
MFTNRPHPKNPRPRALAVALSAVTAVSALAACTGAGSSGGAGNADATLTVWTDDTRQPAVEAYVKAHPQARVKVVLTSYKPGEVAQKIALADRAGKGWPDVVFLGSPSDVSALAAAPLRFAQPLDELVPEQTRKQFAKGTLEGCTYEGKVFCLANDTAPVVLWTNETLMKQFGYSVPKTWAEYQELGVKLGKEHPGYVIGGINDVSGYGAFFGGSGCPDRETTGPADIRIDLTDRRCTRVAELLQPLVENGTVTATSPWDPTFTEEVGKKNAILMYPAAGWFGEYGFKGSYKIPDGQLAAHPVPTWAGDSVATTGAMGGGLWVVSRHSPNVKGAAEIATWLTTSDAADGIVAASALPAHTPTAQKWCAARAADRFYAADPCPTMLDAAGRIAENYDYIRFEGQFADSYAQTFVATASKKGDLAGALPVWQKQLVQAAENAGYKVSR